MKELYESGMTIDQIASKLGISRATVARKLKILGVKMRKRGPTQAISYTTRRGRRDGKLTRAEELRRNK